MLDRSKTRPLAPFDLRLVHRKPLGLPALEQRLQGTSAFVASELMTKAEMNSGPECNMPVWLSLKFESLRMGISPPASILAGGDGVSIVVRRARDHDAFDQRTSPRASEKS